MQWRAPQLTDREQIRKLTEKTEYMGNDMAFANLYLLREKYHTQISFEEGFLFRKYNGPLQRKGYAFPSGGDLSRIRDAIELLSEDAFASGVPFEFCFLSEAQTRLLEQLYPGRFSFSCDERESDYIYLTENLSSFKGRKYHKHRNRASKFERTYPDLAVRKIEDPGTAADAWTVEEKWLAERSENNEMIAAEKHAIREALTDFDALGLRGIVIYAAGRPAAMSIAAEIGSKVSDILFEKSYGEYADNGGYSVVCRSMAGALTGKEYINREEDLGISGLKRSKMSYRPTMLFRKYHAHPINE